MGNVVVCARGGKPVYIADNIEELTGFSAQEAAAMPPALASQYLATAQKTFQRELERSRGQPFHSYRYSSVLRHRDGRMIETHNTVCIVRADGDNDVIVVAVIRPCSSLLRKVMRLWPHLSAASARLVYRIVKSLVHYAV